MDCGKWHKQSRIIEILHSHNNIDSDLDWKKSFVHLIFCKEETLIAILIYFNVVSNVLNVDF